MPAFADTGVISVVSGQTFQVNYNANGVKIQDIETDPANDELTVMVQVSSPSASLELTIPRALLDAKQGNTDTPFLTVVDGTFVNTKEMATTSTTRTISLQLVPDNTQIEIIGTYVAAPGPNGAGAQITPLPSSSNSPTQPSTKQMSSQSTTASVPHTHVTQNSTLSNIPRKNIANTSPLANTNSNIVLKIPYVPNVAITLSPIDLGVIVAISLVVIIVVASVARKRPNKIVKSR